jgi:hypothetical protein
MCIEENSVCLFTNKYFLNAIDQCQAKQLIYLKMMALNIKGEAFHPTDLYFFLD